LAHLQLQYQAAYERTALDLARPAADFIGFRGGQQVASISCRPPSPDSLVDRFTLACQTLGALDLDWAALLAGDEFALAVTAPGDHPADPGLFIVALTVGPGDVDPAGTIIPYRLDRDSGVITWAPSRPVVASCTDGLWAKVFGPLCLRRSGSTVDNLMALLEANRRVDNEVLLL
jgi:hypothetical protein